jgi:hypothetical protein
MTDLLYALFANTTNLKDLTIAQLAEMIRKDWGEINRHAAPYLIAMETLTTIQDNHEKDSGKFIVANFLSMAVDWKGSLAHAIKAELKRRIEDDNEHHTHRFTPNTPKTL